MTAVGRLESHRAHYARTSPTPGRSALYPLEGAPRLPSLARAEGFERVTLKPGERKTVTAFGVCVGFDSTAKRNARFPLAR